MNNKKKTYKQKCKRCGYKWDSRLERPKCCSFCKQFIKYD